MIQQRHLFLLRDTGYWLRDTAPPHYCRICSTDNRGNTPVPVGEQASHLEAHREEKIVRPVKVVGGVR